MLDIYKLDIYNLDIYKLDIFVLHSRKPQICSIFIKSRTHILHMLYTGLAYVACIQYLTQIFNFTQ